MSTIHPTHPHAVFFFCQRLDRDPVASRVFATLSTLAAFEETNLCVDGFPVLRAAHANGQRITLVRTDDVISHDYRRYLPVMTEHFGDATLAGVVNWHEGAHAPDAIFTVHTTGDVPSGYYGAADARLMHGVLSALEQARIARGLDHYTTVTEATHWSGIPHGGMPELIPEYSVPLMDIEIGSTPSCWEDPVAATVMAQALLHVFDHVKSRVLSLLCIGGMHFEPGFRNPVFASYATMASLPPLAVSHILPNHGIAGDEYVGDAGLAKLRACVASIRGRPDVIVFHESLKSAQRSAVHALGGELGVPVVSHKQIRRAEIQASLHCVVSASRFGLPGFSWMG